MGADIHLCLERKYKDNWVLCRVLDWETKAGERNYERFAELASVRGEGRTPKGKPDDISSGAEMFLEDDGGDAHSISYMDLKEAIPIFLRNISC